MTSKDIEYALAILKVDSRGSLRNKGRAIDLIHSHHLRDIDALLTDIRLFVAVSVSKIKNTDELAESINGFIYLKQNLKL